jgi:hypothetical protein
LPSPSSTAAAPTATPPAAPSPAAPLSLRSPLLQLPPGDTETPAAAAAAASVETVYGGSGGGGGSRSPISSQRDYRADMDQAMNRM